MTGIFPPMRILKCTIVVSVVVILLGIASVVRSTTTPSSAPRQPERATAKPNVLFIAVDDLNDWTTRMGGYGGAVHTPNLDRLADRGVLFTNAHCSAPVCNPSRASLMTGVRPSTSGVYDNSADWRATLALEDAVTIPGYFRANGYRTIGGGKLFHALSWINHGYGADRNDPNAWDEYYPSKTRQMPDTRFPPGTEKVERGPNWSFEWPRVANGKGERSDIDVPYFMDWGPLPPSDEQFADAKVVDWAIGELKKTHDKPLFLAVGIFKPHIPWFASQEYYDLYPLEAIVLPRVRPSWREQLPPAGQRMGSERRGWHQWIAANDEWKKAVQAYLAAISFADAQIGRLLDALESSPYAENTIIALWSDHGFQLGERETWEKFTLWEESTRVPLIFVVPGVTKASGQSVRPASLLDIYPTLVELTGGTPSPQLEGLSLVPWLEDPATPRERPVVTTHGQGNHAVRSERWRYIHYRDGSEELYDHERDPNEAHNLAGQTKYNSVKERLARWLPAERG